MKRTSVLVWVLSALNAAIAVGGLAVLYATFHHGNGSEVRVPAHPVWVGVPFGLLAAWRALVYIRGLLTGSANHLRPPAEAFAAIAAVSIAWGRPYPPEGGIFLPLLLGGIFGFFAAGAAVGLMLFDITCIRLLRASAV